MSKQFSDILDLMQSMGTILGLLFYAAIVIWTYKDARKRIEDPILVACATALSMLPIVGVLTYLLLRPSEYIADVRERALEIRLMERQLGSQQRCPGCRSHIEADYLACPVCMTKLRESCESCDRPLDPRWALCPYCEAEVPGRTAPVPPSGGRGGQATQPRSSRPTSARPAPKPSSSRPSAAPSRSTTPSKSAPSKSADAPKAAPSKSAPAKSAPRPAKPSESKPARDTDTKKSGDTSKSSDSSKKDSRGSDVRTEPFGPSGSTQRFERSTDQSTMIGTTPGIDGRS